MSGCLLFLLISKINKKSQFPFKTFAMETIDVLARAFVVKWVNVPDNCTVVFQSKPIKRSVNLAVYRSNESRQSFDINNDSSTSLSSSTPNARQRSNSLRSLSLDERIHKSALNEVHNYGLIDGNQVFKNQFKVEKGGIFAFIFDNTFAKNYSKKVLFNHFFVSNEFEINQSNETTHRSNSTTSLTSINHLNNPSKGQYLQGYLLKKKRKKLQGFTKRFFILNFKDNTLSYYQNENSLKMRGEMQLNISIISASKDENSIVIDSGMDIWRLKTLNSEDWKNWINALDFIKLNGSNSNNSPVSSPELPPTQPSSSSNNDDLELYNIYKELDSLPNQLNHEENLDSIKSKLNDLSLKVKSLIKNKQEFNLRSSPTNSIISQDYFDAEEGDIDDHVLMLRSKERRASTFSVDDLSDDEEDSMHVSKLQINVIDEEDLDENPDLYPLPINGVVKRRNIIQPSTTEPQSIFAILRKNVGKDLSSISMPVTANEPISILQKIAEGFEFANLLNDASIETNQDLKFLKVSTFAISCLGSFRSKIRNLRKPFNPILGESYEFINDELNYRLIGEKICHKPQIFTFNIDSENWEVSLTLNPDQKFWGKSVEIINKGSIKLIFKKTGEIFKWSQPSTLLKNIITGDRYSEPASNSLTITSTIGLNSIVEFKKNNASGGFFTSQPRSEEVLISIFTNGNNIKSDYYCEGKWTESIYLKNFKNPKINEKIWQVSALLPNEDKHWGFSKFSSNLNEITLIEKDQIAHTDTRYRPDIRCYENGDIDKAEILKKQLEQTQRELRQKFIDLNQPYKPNFFKKIDELEYELIKHKESNYWERRKVQNWDGVNKLW